MSNGNAVHLSAPLGVPILIYIHMFNTKNDKYIVNVLITLNIEEVKERLRKGKSLISLTNSEQWKVDNYKQEYSIDLLPYGKEAVAYYHRDDNRFSQSFSGAKSVLDENLDISWTLNKGNVIGIVVESEGKKDLLLVTPPLHEVGELMVSGKIKNNRSLGDFKEEKISVNLSDHETVEVMKSGAGGVSDSYLGFRNEVCKISFSTTYYS